MACFEFSLCWTHSTLYDNMSLALSVSAPQTLCLTFLPSLFTVIAGDSRCPVCNTSYKYRRNLLEHMKKHQGQTRCAICQQEFSVAYNLRRHMVTKHGMSRQEVDMLTNKRRYMEYATQISDRQLSWNTGMPVCTDIGSEVRSDRRMLFLFFPFLLRAANCRKMFCCG